MIPEQNQIFVRREGVRKEILKHESVLFDPTTDTIYALNPTAALIWDYCDGLHKVSEIAHKIWIQYDVDQSQVEGDVYQTLDQLDQLSLIMLRGHGETAENKKEGIQGV